MKLLVVEDEIKLAEYLHKGLTEEGFVVDVAHNGIDGMHLATELAYDLIVLDGMLPGIDGLAVILPLLDGRVSVIDQHRAAAMLQQGLGAGHGAGAAEKGELHAGQASRAGQRAV